MLAIRILVNTHLPTNYILYSRNLCSSCQDCSSALSFPLVPQERSFTLQNANISRVWKYWGEQYRQSFRGTRMSFNAFFMLRIQGRVQNIIVNIIRYFICNAMLFYVTDMFRLSIWVSRMKITTQMQRKKANYINMNIPNRDEMSQNTQILRSG